MKYRLLAVLLVALVFLTAAVAAPTLEERVDRLEAAVFGPTATQPTKPEPLPIVARADTEKDLRAAIASGATLIQTTGIDLAGDIDARGATIELFTGGPSWKPAVSLSGDASLANATIKIPPSTFNDRGQRTSFFKAVTASGRNMTLRNVTFAENGGFCIHHFGGRLTMESVKATTFSEYFIFQEPGSHAIARWCEVRGGSSAESVWRTAGGTYQIEDTLLDNSAGGKSALRGDSPGTEAAPGGIVRRSKFVGQIGPNPLTEDDGGQMLGIDRWRFAEGWIYQLDWSRKAETIAFARGLFLAGQTPEQIVRACADKFVDPAQFAKVARGKTRLTDGDIRLTLDLRAREVGRRSTVLIEDSEIVGDLRLNSRVSGTIRRSRIISSADATPISGASQAAYPFPLDRVIVAGEVSGAPTMIFDEVEISGGRGLGIDIALWPSLTFRASSYGGRTLSQEVRR